VAPEQQIEANYEKCGGGRHAKAALDRPANARTCREQPRLQKNPGFFILA
jgi:hypothetical protein